MKKDTDKKTERHRSLVYNEQLECEGFAELIRLPEPRENRYNAFHVTNM